MPKEHLSLSFFTTASEAGRSLESVLLDRLESELSQLKPAIQVSKHRIRSLVMASCVQVDQKLQRNPKHILAHKIKVSLSCDPYKFFAVKQVDDTDFSLSDKDIIYEDEHIFVINKAAGIPSDASFVQSRHHALAASKRFLALRDKEDQPYLVLQHRLDKDTSGLLLMSKSPAANPKLHQAFAQHQIQKTYSALCSALLGAQVSPSELLSGNVFRLSNKLARISPKSQAAKWGVVLVEGEQAITDLRLVQSGKLSFEFEAKPLTGRTHQIRVHLASCGLPLVGDSLYGGSTLLGGHTVRRHMLHAARLEFTHPISGKPLSLEAAFPADFIACRHHFF